MIVLALESLYAAVIAQFAADSVPTPNLFGWRVAAQHQIGTSRIVWVPGDASNSVGATLPARNPGGSPRTIAVLDELVTVYISAQDPSDPENELAQYHLTRLLRDAWYRAVYLKAHGTFELRAEQWIADKTERRWGATIRVVFAIQSPVWDALDDYPVVDAVQDAHDAGTVVTDGTDVILDLLGDLTP